MGKFNVQLFKTTITIADGGTIGNSSALTINGLVRRILLDIPAMTTSVNTVLTLIYLDGTEEFVLFTSGNLAENGNRVITNDGETQPNPLQVPITTNCKIRLTAAGVQSGAKAIPVYLLIERNN